MNLEKYCHYFDIDPEYKPQVDLDLIERDPECWKRFYPHETFITLLENTIDVLERKQTVSLWVEGAYGTGKSHAVLTLKKLIEAPDGDVVEYFDKYKSQLNKDIFNRFKKMREKKDILVVHRYGASGINNDADLVFAIQESILKALKDLGINKSEGALKESAIAWLSDGNNKNYFNSIIKSEYTELFAGDDVDKIIEKLNTYSGLALSEVMKKIMKVGEEKRFLALSLSVGSLKDWIESVIEENKFKGILFIWDEFTEYFQNNMRALTGFQSLADMSATVPFYFLIVTHNVTHIFSETDNDWKKILGRFINPICNIELPENMAFRLIGAALNKNQDPVVLEEWEGMVEDLYDRTSESRELVKNKARIDDKELKAILPIHPYTALLMKYISSAFDSNQRSMFDFIKNDRGDKIKGFQWFIKEYGPESSNPFLTLDLLWDFFYEKGKRHLSQEIRSILDCYERANVKTLTNDEQRVFKAILLLQAISQRVGDTVPLFIANEKNINNAFEGSDLDVSVAARIANELVQKQLLFVKSIGTNDYQFAALINVADNNAIEKKRAEVERKTTATLVKEGELDKAIELLGALNLRYKLGAATVTDFRKALTDLEREKEKSVNKIMALVTFAKDDAEEVAIGKKIKETLEKNKDFVFIDTSVTPMGKDLYTQYVNNMANSLYHRGKDNTQANQYEQYANEILKKWKNKILKGEFIVYTAANPNGKRVVSLEELSVELKEINKQYYPQALEINAHVTGHMWAVTNLKEGAECGALQETSGRYNTNNENLKLENYIGEGAWKVDKYWEKNPNLPISILKRKVDEVINEAFKIEGKVSIAKIYEALQQPPYGILPCSLTAFVLGFLLKEYIDGSYSWSNGSVNDALNITKLKDMIDEIIKLQNTPNKRYRDNYIVKMTEEAKEFIKLSSKIFHIQKNQCTSVEITRDRIRQEMKKFYFPIWSLNELIEVSNYKTDKEILKSAIDAFCGIVNNNNSALTKTVDDLSLYIGNLCLKNKNLVEDLAQIVTKDNCIEGMKLYIQFFNNGELIELANNIGDGGQYVNQVKKKFDAEDANWLWNKETANEKIEEVTLEYKIIDESNKILPKTISFNDTIKEWCERCDNIKISYSFGKVHWNELSDFMEQLYRVKQSASLPSSKKQHFLNALISSGQAFNNFYLNQFDFFKTACNYLLDQNDFVDDQVLAIFNSIPNGQFLKDKADYQKMVSEAIEKYFAESKEQQLRDMWLEKTGTESPEEWSIKNKMPVLCMVPDKDLPKAKIAFATLNKKHADSAAIDKAIEYLNTVDYFDSLNDKDKRDEAFRTKILKEYAVILKDIDQIKNDLMKSSGVAPYDWFGLPLIDKKLEQKAKIKYIESDCNLALKKIESMDVEDVKKYLKELIKDNMTVGIEIIKDN